MQESKSIGADVNWGVRFKDQKDVRSPLNIILFCPFVLMLIDSKSLLNSGTMFSVKPLQGGFITFAGVWSDREEVYLKGLSVFCLMKPLFFIQIIVHY